MNIQDRYKIKDEIDHILDRSGMWIGSVINEFITTPIYYPTKNIIKLTDNVPENQGMLKLIDEVFSNSIDEYRRSKASKKESLFDITRISLSVNSDGTCCVQDNGGIPVIKHEITDAYIPRMIFGMLRTSSNYDDSTDREWIGTYGLGAKITNIFSDWFEIDTADGKNSYKCRWENNMGDVIKEEIKPSKEHYTKISFKIQLSRFDISKIEIGTIRILQKKAIDAAASNPGLIINFDSDVSEGILKSSWKFDNFKEYISLFIENDDNEDLNDNLLEFNSGKDNILIYSGSNIPDIGFVNGTLCSAGSHINKIQRQICDKMIEICQKNEMELISEKDILQRFSVFINCTIVNPKYDSQAKTKLTVKLDSHKLQLDKKFLDKLKNSNLFISLKDFYDIKYKEEKKKELRKLNKAIKESRSAKLIKPAVKDKNLNELFLFEGNSAAGAFRKNRTHFQAAYLLKGKIRNTLNLSRSQIIENDELREIVAILGLQFEDAANNLKNLQYEKIVICTDMDFDGSHIAGLLIAFFSKHFPELYMKNKIYRALSPLITCTKGKEIKYYYNMNDFERDKFLYGKGWDLQYTKGLGGLTDIDYKEMLQNPKLLCFQLNKNDKEQIDIWFDKSTEVRKQILLEENTDE